MNIAEKIKNIRTVDIKNFLTNCFFTDFTNACYISDNDKALIFLLKDRDIYRLYFACNDLSALSCLLDTLPSDLKISFEYITKFDMPENLHNLITKYFIFDTEYQRMRVKCTDLRQFKKYSANEIETANEDDIQYICEVLNKTFNHYSSHLPSIEELYDLQKNKQVLVTRNDKSLITSFMLFKLNGKSSNFDQLVSIDHNALNTMKLLDYYNSVIKLKNINDSFLWVDVINNKPVVKMHKLFGYNFDGLNLY